MAFAQLDPMLPVHVTGRGDGFAIAVIDYGQEHNLIWVTAITATGEIWCAPNPTVRLLKNWTMGRHNPLQPPEKSSNGASQRLET
jgi:hypothetical protein